MTVTELREALQAVEAQGHGGCAVMIWPPLEDLPDGRVKDTVGYDLNGQFQWLRPGG